MARKEPRTKYFLMRDLLHLFGVWSELPAGGLAASVPPAPMLVAFGVRSGEGLPGVRSEVFPASEPQVPGEFPLLDELFISPLLQAAIHSF